MGITEGIRFKTKTSERAASKLRFTVRQATAILEMRLYKLIGLEIEALMKEHDLTLANIAKYENILNHYDAMAEVIITELDAVKKEYGQRRKTVIETLRKPSMRKIRSSEMEVCVLMDPLRLYQDSGQNCL